MTTNSTVPTGKPQSITERRDANYPVASSAKTGLATKRKTRDKAAPTPTSPRIFVYRPEYALPVRSKTAIRSLHNQKSTYPIAVKGERGRPKKPLAPPLPENKYGIPIDIWGEEEIRRQPKTRPMDPVDEGFADWISMHQHWGWRAYLVTFMFNNLPGNPKARVDQMGKRITKFYSALLPHMMHHPNRKVNLCRRPIMVAVPETKWRRALRAFKLEDVCPNDGWHFHAVLLVSPWVRKKTKPFDEFFERERLRFFDTRDELRAVDVRPMDDQSRRVWSYITKAQFRNPEKQDDILLLPDVKSNEGFRAVVAEEQAARAEKNARLRAGRLARVAAAAIAQRRAKEIAEAEAATRKAARSARKALAANKCRPSCPTVAASATDSHLRARTADLLTSAPRTAKNRSEESIGQTRYARKRRC